jgi:four helix bundle protein
MSIASKEARETYYWLKLINDGKLVEMDVTNYIKDIKNIINILTAIVKTTKNRINDSKAQ